jgi:hypothetical protein
MGTLFRKTPYIPPAGLASLPKTLPPQTPHVASSAAGEQLPPRFVCSGRMLEVWAGATWIGGCITASITAFIRTGTARREVGRIRSAGWSFPCVSRSACFNSRPYRVFGYPPSRNRSDRSCVYCSWDALSFPGRVAGQDSAQTGHPDDLARAATCRGYSAYIRTSFNTPARPRTGRRRFQRHSGARVYKNISVWCRRPNLCGSPTGVCGFAKDQDLTRVAMIQAHGESFQNPVRFPFLPWSDR